MELGKQSEGGGLGGNKWQMHVFGSGGRTANPAPAVIDVPN